MKKIAGILMIMSLALLVSFTAASQQPPHPPSDPNSGGDQNPSGNPTGVPVGTGTGMLLLLAAGYGAAKYREVRKKSEPDEGV